jgi:cytochrome c oxidase subunit 2
MHIHRFERAWFALALLLIVALVGTVTYGATAAGVEMLGDSGQTIENSDLSGTEFEDPGVRAVGDDEYDVYVVARQFVFEPGTSNPIRLPAGSTVTFYVTSADVVHGFEIAGTNVNTMAIPGQVAELTVEFDEPATYGLICHEYCGAGHHTMEGKVEIVPAAEYDGPEGDS